MTTNLFQKLNSIALALIVASTLFYGAVGPQQPSVFELASGTISAVQFQRPDAVCQ